MFQLHYKRRQTKMSRIVWFCVFAGFPAGNYWNKCLSFTGCSSFCKHSAWSRTTNRSETSWSCTGTLTISAPRQNWAVAVVAKRIWWTPFARRSGIRVGAPKSRCKGAPERWWTLPTFDGSRCYLGPSTKIIKLLLFCTYDYHNNYGGRRRPRRSENAQRRNRSFNPYAEHRVHVIKRFFFYHQI